MTLPGFIRAMSPGCELRLHPSSERPALLESCKDRVQPSAKPKFSSIAAAKYLRRSAKIRKFPPPQILGQINDQKS